MLKRTILFLMVILLFAIAGCSDNSTDVGAYDPYIGGDSALSMDFVEGAPPEQVFDDTQYPFSVSVKLDNNGEYSIDEGNGFVEIKGISAEEFGLSQSDLKQDIPSINGARKNADGSILQGQSDVVTFDDLTYQQDLAGDLEINNFRVRACYDYETYASSQLCIKDSNVDGLKDNEVCLINEPKRVVNSGAPLKISNLAETSKGKNGIQVSFDIAHVGPAQNKWFPTGDEKCDNRIDNKELYKVYVEVDPIINGRYDAECNGGSFNGGNSGEVTLFNGESRKVICSFNVGEQDSDFETRLNLKLRYRYLQFIEKSLVIKDLGNEDYE